VHARPGRHGDRHERKRRARVGADLKRGPERDGQ